MVWFFPFIISLGQPSKRIATPLHRYQINYERYGGPRLYCSEYTHRASMSHAYYLHF